MDNLVALVGTLKQRIEQYHAQLGANEWLTRSALVDPLLRGLGWNTEDPSQVVPEYKVHNSSEVADYALITDKPDAPAVAVEVKKLGQGLTSDANKAAGYCNTGDIDHFAVTDGNVWEVYETLKKGGLNNKRIVKFVLSSDSPADICRRMVALWRQGFVDGAKPVAATGLQQGHGKEPTVQQEPQPVHHQDHLVALSKLDPAVVTKTSELAMPDDTTVPAKHWIDIPLKVARWLLANGHLSAETKPLRRENSKLYVLAKAAEHGGKRFTKAKLVGDGWFMESNLDRVGCVENARAIAKHCGVAPAKFKVRT